MTADITADELREKADEWEEKEGWTELAEKARRRADKMDGTLVDDLKERAQKYDDLGWDDQAQEVRDVIEELEQDGLRAVSDDLDALQESPDTGMEELDARVEDDEDTEELSQEEVLEAQIEHFERKGWTKQAEEAREKLEDLRDE